MTKKIKKKLIALCLVALAVLTGGVINFFGLGNHQTMERVTVVKVVDGDTIKIDYHGKTESLRLIGIDTPESVHPDKTKNTAEGRATSKYVKSLLEGKTVEVEWDVQQRDKYGRLLGYVYLDGEMINERLIKEGKARIATYPPNVKYVDKFKAAAKETPYDF